MRVGRGPRLTDADRAAWASFVRTIARLPDRPPPEPAPEMPATAAATVTAAPSRPRPEPPSPPKRPVAPVSIGAPPAGVDSATWQRFRTGKLAATRKLDLHGMTAQRAYHALEGFLRTAQADRVRCVEIVTGRGSGEGTGVIRREFPLWLNLPQLRPLILGAAHPHAANPGAVRLLLRRPR
jgi:DNA-nicking Smr family endonuclease